MAEDVRVPEQAFGGNRIAMQAVLGGVAFPPGQDVDCGIAPVVQRCTSRVGIGAGSANAPYTRSARWNAP
jgi:hypothetical protein